MFLRWMRDATRIHAIARDAGVSLSTGYRYIWEAIAVVAAYAPTLKDAIAQAAAHGDVYIILDGTLIDSDRCSVKTPGTRKDQWYSGKHKRHGGNIQVVMDPTGYPLWTSEVSPGSTHDIEAARNFVFPGLQGKIPILADKGYQGAGLGVHTPTKGHRDKLTADQRQRNQIITDLRAPGERANAMLKTWRVLQHVTMSPERIGDITAAALVFTHMKYPNMHLTGSW
jgi:hypothetical protein